jgi:hypothetical protein
MIQGPYTEEINQAQSNMNYPLTTLDNFAIFRYRYPRGHTE